MPICHLDENEKMINKQQNIYGKYFFKEFNAWIEKNKIASNNLGDLMI